ncbi:hypothetical protein BKA62DRAFT_610935 [Auriculariales sp. MPI-PUGE-AT-0066]|nr:hypothetical protein BKA62DRAFT_610935 [Auriculariales sp. MPI-PUGE-AT-0066]
MPIYIPHQRPILATEALLLSQPDLAGSNRPASAPAPHPSVAFPATPPRRKNSSPTSPGGLAVPSTPRPHAHSNPTAPSSPAVNDNDVTRCAGITKGDRRCQNKVKAGIPLTYIDGVPEEDIERYCHLHLKVILEPTGLYSRKQPNVWLEFTASVDPLIPDNLSQGTQAALRTEISKAASSKDGPGYVYTFEIRQSDDSQYMHLKVGKASKVTRRLDEWNKQCPEEVVPRGVWPAPDNDGPAMLRGKIQPGRPSPFMGRLERLVHLELADLAVYAPYLPEAERPPVPGDGRSGPRRSSSDDAVAAGKSKKSTPIKPPQRQRVVCACGTVHQEIFIFKRAKKGDYKDGIWENLVRPVIARWGTFVDEHVAP